MKVSREGVEAVLYIPWSLTLHHDVPATYRCTSCIQAGAGKAAAVSRQPNMETSTFTCGSAGVRTV
jgi:hypothetical protein